MADKPTPEDYRAFIDRQWKDLHHSRVQEWTALGVVTGAHVGLLQLVSLIVKDHLNFSLFKAAVFASVMGALFSVFGALMTCRHRRLMQIKLQWIHEAEKHLCLIKTPDNPNGIVPSNSGMGVAPSWKGLSLPRALSTSWLILCFYGLLIAIDAFSLAIFGVSASK